MAVLKNTLNLLESFHLPTTLLAGQLCLHAAISTLTENLTACIATHSAREEQTTQKRSKNSHLFGIHQTQRQQKWLTEKFLECLLL